MASYVVIDFETASQTDLVKAGAWAYAECPTTEILCLGYQTDEMSNPVVMSPENIADRFPGHTLMQLVSDPKVLFVAHNAAFEKAIWRNIMVKQFGWPDLPNSRWHCSMAVCAMKALPMKLERAALALRLVNQTGSDHRKIVTAPSKAKKDGSYDRSTELLGAVYRENQLDVVAETELNHRIGGFQQGERNVWLLDQRINERGVRVDLEYVAACRAIVDGASKPLVEEFRALTGVNPGQRNKVLKWIQAQGVNLPNLQKETITKLIGPEFALDDDDEFDGDTDADEDYATTPLLALPASARRALEIRRTVGSASIKKLGAIQNCVSADGRVRGLVLYHGAGPGRWVGRLFQPHNFPRGTLKFDRGTKSEKPPSPEIVAETLMSGDWRYVASVLGNPIEAVISGLRHAIITDEGRILNAGDFASIECRGVLALAGQHDKCNMIADGKDVYVDMAETIYKREINKTRDPEQRQIGKNTVLGCGFQMGWETFGKRYAPDDTEEFKKKVIAAYREEWAPEVPKLWAGLEEAAIRAVWDHRTTNAYGIEFKHEDIWLTARIHSGRKLYYAFPQQRRKAMPWDPDDIRPAWSCMAWKKGRWMSRDIYGGLMTQNVIEAQSRDLICGAMFKCEKENLPIVLTVHDEIIAEPLTEHSNPDMLKQIMCDRPQWAIEMGIPIGAETWAGGRYKK